MRFLIVALLALACAAREAPAPGPAAVAHQTVKPRAKAVPPRPLPAADDAPCARDAECAATRVPAGGCCPSSCDPRPVTAQRAAALDAATASCRPACAEPQCAPERTQLVVTCQAGRCVGHDEPMR